MSLQSDINSVASVWAELLGNDLKVSLDKALTDSGSKRGQYDLTFFPDVKVASNGDVSIKILASGDYWDYIESGVDGTKVKHGSPYSYEKKAISFDAMEKFIKRSSINAPRILAEMKFKAMGGISLRTKRRLSKPKKKLSFDESVKRLSRVFAVAKARDGSEPKPFIDRVFNNDRLGVLTDAISELMGREITATLDLSGDFRNVKIEI